MIRPPVYSQMSEGFDIIDNMVRDSNALFFMQTERGNIVQDHVMLNAMEKAGGHMTDLSAYKVPLSPSTPLKLAREARYHQSIRLVAKLYRTAAADFAAKTYTEVKRRTSPGQDPGAEDRSRIRRAAGLYCFSRAMEEVFCSDKIFLLGIKGTVTAESFARVYGAQVDSRMPVPGL